MEKNELRNTLFNKYYECTDGVSLLEIEAATRSITEVFLELKKIMVEESGSFISYNNISGTKFIVHNEKEYLFIKQSMLNYYVLDLELKKILTDDDKYQFGEDFFKENFKENFENLKFEDFLNFNEYDGNIYRIYDYVQNNRDVLSLENLKIFYDVNKYSARSTLIYNIYSGTSQLHFNTDDQYLYEQLFFDRFFKPLSIQDTKEKIGLDKMNEIFEAFPSIKIPSEKVPDFIKDDTKKLRRLINE